MSPEQMEAIRHHFDIKVTGDDVTPPAATFAEMKLPREIQSYLEEQGIHQPSPIQMQGIPCALAGRDVLAAAPTGSGKSLLLLLPLLASAFHAIAAPPRSHTDAPPSPPRGPGGGEGRRGGVVTAGLCVASTKELAFQLQDAFHAIANRMWDARGVRVEASVLVGPEANAHTSPLKLRHVVFGTPGRVAAALKQGALALRELRTLCLDEVHRLYLADDTPPSKSLHQLLSGIGSHVQKICCSSTLPDSVASYISQHLHTPIVVRVGGRLGLSADVTHEVHLLPESLWLPFLVCDGGALFKTAPPALVLCSERRLVEHAHTFLQSHGVRAGMLHSKLPGPAKAAALRAFPSPALHVLVATDMAASGLHFPDLAHVVCLGMDRKGAWVHVQRAGRVGRGGRCGLVTLLLDRRHTDQALIQDLREMLADAGQPAPAALAAWK